VRLAARDLRLFHILHLPQPLEFSNTP
jgi:hypothetical protein